MIILRINKHSHVYNTFIEYFYYLFLNSIRMVIIFGDIIINFSIFNYQLFSKYVRYSFAFFLLRTSIVLYNIIHNLFNFQYLFFSSILCHRLSILNFFFPSICKRIHEIVIVNFKM